MAHLTLATLSFLRVSTPKVFLSSTWVTESQVRMRPTQSPPALVLDPWLDQSSTSFQFKVKPRDQSATVRRFDSSLTQSFPTRDSTYTVSQSLQWYLPASVATRKSASPPSQTTTLSGLSLQVIALPKLSMDSKSELESPSSFNTTPHPSSSLLIGLHTSTSSETRWKSQLCALLLRQRLKCSLESITETKSVRMSSRMSPTLTYGPSSFQLTHLVPNQLSRPLSMKALR